MLLLVPVTPTIGQPLTTVLVDHVPFMATEGTAVFTLLLSTNLMVNLQVACVQKGGKATQFDILP